MYLSVSVPESAFLKPKNIKLNINIKMTENRSKYLFFENTDRKTKKNITMNINPAG